MVQSFNKSINWDNVSSNKKYLYNHYTDVELAALLADFNVSNCRDMPCKNIKHASKISNFYNGIVNVMKICSDKYFCDRVITSQKKTVPG